MKRNLLGLFAIVLSIAMLLPAPAFGSFEGRKGKIAFARGGERSGIWVMRPDGTGKKRLSRRNDGSPVWAPDGSMIAFIRWDAGYTSNRIMVMNADGSGKRSVGTGSIGNGCALQFPHWSYDGLFLAYTDDCFDREPRVAQIRVASAVGGDELEVTDYSSLNGLSFQPWSPNLEDSAQLAFASDRDGDADVYVMNSDGTDVRQLTTNDDDQFNAVWSPAGDSIAFVTQAIQPSGSARTSIVTINPAGTGETEIVTGSPFVTEPLWSPNGALIAATRRTRSFAPTSIVVNSDGSGERTIDEGAQTVGAAWAPDSRSLLFGEGDVLKYRLTADGAERVALTSGPTYESGVDWQALPN